MKRFLLVTQLILSCVLLASSQTNQKKTINAFYLGHSLSDGVPEMVWGLALKSSNTSFDYGYQRINGTPLRNQWNQMLRQSKSPYLDFTDKEMLKVFDSTIVDEGANLYRFFDDKNGLASGKYSHLVLTESVPRSYEKGWGNIENTYRYVDSFYNYAKRFNPDVKPYLYEVWHCINSGTPEGCSDDKNPLTFRERLKKDLAMWESVIHKFNSKKPRQKIQLIPVGQGLGNLYDVIEKGGLPGVKSLKEFFTDEIHVNDTLRYFNACIHYATLFEQSPVGLTNQLNHIWGSPFVTLNPDLARRLQEIAWQTVQQYNATQKRKAR